MYDVLSRVKMIYINKNNQSYVFSQILSVCKKYTNSELLKHILQKIVPFFYCINEFSSKIVSVVAEMLHYVVTELNTSYKLNIDKLNNKD